MKALVVYESMFGNTGLTRSQPALVKRLMCS